MALKKKTLIDFLVETREQLIEDVKTKYVEKIKIIKDEIYDSLNIDTLLDKYQEDINRIANFHKLLVESPTMEKNKVSINSSYWNCPVSTFNTLSSETYKLRMQSYLNYESNPKIIEFEKEKANTINDIRKNYNLLISNCNSMPSGKKIQAYLEGLGYDLTELKKKENEVVSLSSPIDIDKLGINIINKKNKQEDINVK